MQNYMQVTKTYHENLSNSLNPVKIRSAELKTALMKFSFALYLYIRSLLLKFTVEKKVVVFTTQKS